MGHEEEMVGDGSCSQGGGGVLFGEVVAAKLLDRVCTAEVGGIFHGRSVGRGSGIIVNCAIREGDRGDCGSTGAVVDGLVAFGGGSGGSVCIGENGQWCRSQGGRGVVSFPLQSGSEGACGCWPAVFEMIPKLCSGREALHAVGTPEWAAGGEVGAAGSVLGALREGRLEWRSSRVES